MGKKNKEFYTQSAKVNIGNIRNIALLDCSFMNNNSIRYGLYDNKGTLFNIREEEFQILAPIFGLSGLEPNMKRYIRVNIRTDFRKVIEKIKNIENATGEEEYTEVLDENDLALSKILEETQAKLTESMNKLYNTRRI